MLSRSRNTSWVRPLLALICFFALAAPLSAAPNKGKGNQNHRRFDKLDDEVRGRSNRILGTSRVIITFKPGAETNGTEEARRLGGRLGRRLRLLNGAVVELPNFAIKKLAERSEVLSIHYDRPIGGHMSRAAVAVGSRAVQDEFGYDGAGVGVAVIDSGIMSSHDDFGYSGTSLSVRRVNGKRVTAFVDFVGTRTTAYDDNGHGTHVSGIIAGSGYDSYGAHAGIAPGAHLVSLKVLDGNGQGVISDVIAALEWVVTNRAAHNIRVVNLSVGARITESYMTDPLTLAAKRAADAGIVVVTAAGNFGKRSSTGETQYGGITAPGNAPWVLTVGAYSTQGTALRFDDRVAPYSSRGPSAIDYASKPDVVAPGTGIVSLANPHSLFYTTKATALLGGNRNPGYKPYLSLSGTSMASPVVAGTVALMLQANPSLTPNLVKAILQYTAQDYRYDALTQGAGFLNARGAVQLSRFYARARSGDRFPSSWGWSKQIIWGNQRLKKGVIKPSASAWGLNIVWGTAFNDNGDNIVWGTVADLDNIVWGTLFESDNIVWGTLMEGDNIVWGTLFESDNIVWGTLCGGSDCDNIVWGTAMDLDNIVWGTAMDLDNIVWGTSGEMDNIVWGTSADVTWGNSGEDDEMFDDPLALPVLYNVPVDELFPPDLTSPVTTVTEPVTSLVSGLLEGGL